MDYEVLPPTRFVLSACSGVSIVLYGQSQVRIEESEGEKKSSYLGQLAWLVRIRTRAASVAAPHDRVLAIYSFCTYRLVRSTECSRQTATELPAAVTYMTIFTY
jgi:hypothetical protein